MIFSPCCFFLSSYTETTYSGLTKENESNSLWSKFIINNLSVGVNFGASLVNSWSKFDVSRGPFWKIKNKNLK